MEFKRKLYERLLQWKKEENGRTAMLIEGARRVGKSTLAEAFGKNEYKSYLMIDFSQASTTIKNIFVNEIDDLDSFFLNLSLYYGKRLYSRESLIIFDEIQSFPRAREIIKLLVKDGRYDYLESGSLISIKKNVKDIVIPSEEEKIELLPFDFEEFCWALGDEVTVPFLKKCFNEKKQLGSGLRKVMERYRLYLAIGGMPQAIKEYSESKSFERVDHIKKMIIDTYKDDIGKFASPYVAQATRIFEDIPSTLSKHDKTISFYSLDSHGRFSSYDDALLWFSESMVANIAYGVTSPRIDQSSSFSERSCKCYMGDTGLLINLAVGDRLYIDNELYKSIILGKLSMNEGMIMENAVAQALRANGHNLYFYKNRIDVTSTERKTYEVDFLIEMDGKVCPIEVKSSSAKKHDSLDHLQKAYGDVLASPIVLSPGDLREKDGIIYLPLPMACLL